MWRTLSREGSLVPAACTNSRSLPSKDNPQTSLLCAGYICYGLCFLVSLVAGVALLALAIIAKTARDEYTPVYRTIVCGAHVIEDYSESTSTSEIRGSAIVSYPCENNNPYSVTIGESEMGVISMGQLDALDRIGTIVMLRSVLEPGIRNSNVRLLLNVSLEGAAASDLLERFFFGSQNIYVDVPFTVDVMFQALGQSFHYHSSMNKKCGFQMDVDVEPQMRSQFGFVWCGETYRDIYIQPLENLTGSLFTTFPLAHETLDKLAYKRDVNLGAVLGVSACVSFSCLLLAAVLAFRLLASNSEVAPRFICDVDDDETESMINDDVSCASSIKDVLPGQS